MLLSRIRIAVQEIQYCEVDSFFKNWHSYSGGANVTDLRKTGDWMREDE